MSISRLSQDILNFNVMYVNVKIWELYLAHHPEVGGDREVCHGEVEHPAPGGVLRPDLSLADDGVAPDEPGEVAADEAGEHVEVDGDAAAVEGLVGPEDEDGEEEAEQGQAVAGVSQQQDVRPGHEYACYVSQSPPHTHVYLSSLLLSILY